MSDTIFRAIPNEMPAEPLPVERGVDTVGNMESPQFEPLERGSGAILNVMGIHDDLKNLPMEDKSNYDEIDSYIFDSLDKKGVSPSYPNIKNEFTKLMNNMGLDEHAEPSVVLDRIGGVIKSWKSLSFINDPAEKKQIFFKLANAKTSKEMNKIVFDSMERKNIWQ